MGGTGFLGALLAVFIATTSTQVLDCDFEKDFCQWSQVTTDRLDWSREKGPTATPGTGPSSDHTSGGGFYAYLESSNGAFGDVAQLRSPPLEIHGRPGCLQFYYHMFGPNVASLSVLRVQNNVTKSTIWSKTGNQGDQWKVANVHISTGSNMAIIIQAVRGIDYEGDIAIDDIRYFSSGTCTVTPTQCSFEDGSLCNYTSSGSSTFKWVSTQGAVSTTRKPDHDHSTNTVQGHFAYLDAVSAIPGQQSTLTTTNLILNVDKCLRFFYDLRGTNPGTLAVFRSSNGFVGSALWSVTNAYSLSWSVAEVRLSAANGTNKVIFRATVGPHNSGGTFSLDDISYSTASCRLPATCDFEESDTCTWLNDVGDQFDWIVWQGHTHSNSTGPTNDFTFGNSSGHYLYAEASAPRQQGDKARLISTFIPPPQRSACFNFMYSMNGEDVGTLNLYVRNGQTDTPVWSLSGDQGTDWLPGSFPLPSSAWMNYSQIIIEYVTGKGYRGDIALDDLRFSTISCFVSPFNASPNGVSMTTGSPAAATLPTASPLNPNTIDCNFEGGLCSWTQATDDQKDWIRHRGNAAMTNSGPIVDHTIGSGYYVYLDTKNGSANDKARLISKTISSISQFQCLSFWYQMRGSSTTALNVYLKIGNLPLGNTIWTRHGDYGNSWIKGSVSFSFSATYAIVLEAVQGTSNYGDVAVDDITFNSGYCADNSPSASSATVPPVGASVRFCDFEDGNTMCGYTQDHQDDFNWALTSRNSLNTETGPTSDHTYQTPQGHYILIDATNIRIGAKARLLSPAYNDSRYGALCMHFYSYMFGDGVGSLNIYIKPTSQQNLSQPVWHMSGNQGQRWILGEVNVLASTTQSPYQVVLEGIRGTNYRADIAIDDISFTEGPCPSQGSCSFENGFCSWTNVAGSKVDWDSFRADTNAGTPAGDHTLATGAGSFLFLSSKRNFMAGDKAELVSEMFPPVSNTGRCMTFWYFMSGNVQSTLNIAVNTPGLSQTIFVWQLTNLSPQSSAMWHIAKAPIPVNSNDYYVIIQGLYGSNNSNPTGGIGVDDVSFSDSNCALFPPSAIPKVGLPTPPGPSTLAPQGTFDCTFENGMCGWRQDQTDVSDWAIHTGSLTSGPTGDHTKADGSGHYIYVETSMPRQQDDATRIISTDVNGGTYCLQFYYSMYGQNVGSLYMYVKTGQTLPLPTLHLQATQGRAWHVERLRIAVAGIFNIVFEARSRYADQGDIALDDISMTPGTCASVTPTPAAGTFSSTCSFETPTICGYRQDNDDDFDWTRNSGDTITPNTGPSVDHTLQTAAGYYMYVDTSYPIKAGEKARLESWQIPASPSSPMCVSFWYSMFGITMGTLNIYIKNNNGLGSPVFTRKDNQGMGWKEATISVPPTTYGFSVVFEAVVGNNVYSEIAIDDVTISNTNCTHPGNCNFDTGLCTWQNDIVHDDFDWLQTGWFITPQNGPTADHTFGNASGKFLYIDATLRAQGNKAWYVSQDLSPSNARCLHFWYYMSGGIVGNLNVWVLQSSDGSRVPIWSLTGNQGSQWSQGQALIPPQTGSFQVIFEGVRGISWTGNIALDDISFDSLSGCSFVPAGARSNLATITTVPPPITAPLYSGTAQIGLMTGLGDTATSVNCSFSVNTCGWQQDQSDDFDWLRNKGSTASEETGPDDDHSGGGYYMYIETSNSGYGKKATLYSPQITIPQGQSKCFSFWYYMYGEAVNMLEVLMAIGSTQKQIWIQQGNKGAKWLVAQLPLNSASPVTLYIRGTSSYDYTGDIAIDDITLTDGPCTATSQLAALSCDFESFCKYQGSIGDTLNWTEHTGPSPAELNGPGYDHTTETAYGHYLYIENSGSVKQGQFANLASPVITTGNGDYCLKFWYNMYGQNTGSLSIKLAVVHNIYYLWDAYGDQGDNWYLGQVPFMVTAPQSQIIFEGVVGSGYLSNIALDDITITKTKCTTPPVCNFDNGDMCSWMNLGLSDNFDWILNRANSTTSASMPTRDHSMNSAQGYYIYFGNQLSVANEKAYLLSAELSPTSGVTHCFKFWYSMMGNGVGTLQVNYVVNNTMPGSTLWQYSKATPSQWNLATIPVQSATEFKLLFVGVLGLSNQGIIAVDDITYMIENCGLTPYDALPPGATTASRNTFSTLNPNSFTSSATTFNCNFESNMCAWVNSKNDNYDWTWGGTAAQVGNNSNVPKIDHTTNSGGGHYVYYNMRQGVANGVALLSSPMVSTTSFKCLRYWYNMNSNVKQLNVYIKKGASLSLAQQSIIGSQGPNWHESYLNINATGLYQVVFSGVKGVSGIDGVIALDDITLTDGICEAPALSIVNLTASHSFACDFEQPDLCKFSQDTTDNFDWTQQQHGTDTGQTGPENDHTYGTPDGHYVYAEASDVDGQIKESGDVARLNSPTFVSVGEDICVSFFYHMYGQSMGSLNIRMRTGSNFQTLNPPMWTMSGDLGNQWNIGEVTIPAMMITQNFQIVFEAVRGTSFFSDIALDDVSVKLGPCSSRATCNFDTDTCTYSDYPADYDWIRNNGMTGSAFTGPINDHTQGNSNGYYMYLEASLPHTMGQTAVLNSERLSPTNGSCFTFWYHMYGSTIGTLNILVSVTPTENTTVWSLSGDQGDQWLSGQAPIVSLYNSFFILIQGVKGADYDGDIAIDDVGYHNTPCGTFPDKAKQAVHTLPPPPTVQTSLGPLDCTFERDMCSWTQSTSDVFDWQRQATRDPTTSSGPTADHSGTGFFAFIDSSAPRRLSDNAILNSPSTFGQNCIVFWYYMWGDHINKLNVYRGPNKLQLLWTRQGTQGNKWLQANIFISSSYAYQIQIEAVVGTGAGGDIAIDDISAVSGKCPEALLGFPGVSCDFEEDFCGYVQEEQGDQFDWTRYSGSTPSYDTGPLEDHTYGTYYGHYIYTEASNQEYEDKAVIYMGPVNNSLSDMCLEFWYNMYGDGQGTLTVYTRPTGTSGYGPSLWTKSGNQGQAWIKATVDIKPNSNRIDILFEASIGTNSDSDTAIDDIVLRNGKCAGKGNCDFQMDTCSWSNIHNDSMDWLSHSGQTPSDETGPLNDHTYGNLSGKYLFIETSDPVREGDNAILQSELFDPESDMVCFHFFYNMYGVSIGTLRVWLLYYNTSLNKLPVISRQVVWELSGNQAQAWYEGIVPIFHPPRSYKIQMEGVAGWEYTGDIAIDDISFIHSSNPCILTPAKASPSNSLPNPTPTPPMGQIPANFNCNFDTNLCGWTSDSSGGQLWTRYQGPTTSSDTGPDQDHTSGIGYYIYLETSDGLANLKARLDSPVITPGAQYCFSFWYHMYGETVASLDVQLKAPNGTTFIIWVATGSHGNQWIQAHVDIGVSFKVANQIVLEAVEGSSFTGDIAVDDVQLAAGLCSSGGASPIDCDFETSSICGYMQDKQDQFDWTWFSGGTQSDDTGPTNDHTLGTSAGRNVLTSHLLFICNVFSSGAA
ncbi:hypothetical protein BsWGS_07261 [Bradybaena similaris]